MATQHPDNASKPYWNSRAFVSNSDEIKECYLCFSDLGIEEYNWDWEGKFVDEAVVDKLYNKYYQYFARNPLGEKKYLTFRIPNPRVEKHFRLARALMVMITTSQLAKNIGFRSSPLFEAILPLTETAEEIIDIQEAFSELARIDHKLLKMNDSIHHLEIIPLFEQVEKIIESAHILRRYVRLHKKKFKSAPAYIRPYCARSDPALNSGMVPTVLAVKIALASYKILSDELDIPLYPIVGTGALPFRGGVSPDRIDTAIQQYAGASTLTIQSGFRYDYPKNRVKKAIAQVNERLQSEKSPVFDAKTIQYCKKTIPQFQSAYRDTVEHIAPLINRLSKKIEKRRERLQHIGLFGYSRGVGRVSLPRAIPFTASLYSLGIPPELIGTGRGIKKAKETGTWPTISLLYKNLKKDLLDAGFYVNKENIADLAKRHSYWSGIQTDIEEIEKEFQCELRPSLPHHKRHLKLTSDIYHRLKTRMDPSEEVIQAGKLRGSLG